MEAEALLVERLSDGFLRLHPAEAATVLDRLPTDEIARILGTAAPGAAARAFEGLTAETAAGVIEALDDAALAAILPEVDPARAASILARLDPAVRARRLAKVDPVLAREIESLIAWPADTGGSLMDPRAVSFHPGASVGEALARLRGLGARRIDDVFLVGADGRLGGVVALQELATAPTDASLESLARPATTVAAIATREEVVERLAAGGVTSLAVVDIEGRLLGVIRQDRLVQAVEEEASVDIQTMVGASKEERALSRVGFAVQKRLPWLEINLLTAFLAAAVVGLFESTIARFTALAVLLPVVAGQSGNTGSQALAVTMRGLALREIRLRHWPEVARKEVSVALLNGVAVAATTSAGVYVWSRSVGLALVIGISMVISMAAAGLSGAAIPMILTALRQDPAQSSSIILTTVTDVVGFFSFLGIATMLSGML